MADSCGPRLFNACTNYSNEEHPNSSEIALDGDSG